MNELLTKILDAHGGLERWRSYNKVEATIVSVGGFFALKCVLQDANPARIGLRHDLPRFALLHSPRRPLLDTNCLAETDGFASAWPRRPSLRRGSRGRSFSPGGPAAPSARQLNRAKSWRR